jgi:hypothetical protein
LKKLKKVKGKENMARYYKEAEGDFYFDLKFQVSDSDEFINLS